jgi:hypothetical protein
MLLLALTLALAAPQTAPGAAAVDATPVTDGQPVPVQVVNDPPQARTLCEALTPGERLRLGDDVVAQARAEAQQDARRETALAGRYRVTIPGAAIRFAPYDREEQVLSVSEKTFLAGAGGVLHLWAVSRADLPVTADEAIASRIVSAAKQKQLALVLTFTLPDDEDEAVCANVAGSRHYALGVEPFAWEYVAEGEVLARGGEGGDRPLVTAAQGAKPRVEVSDPYGAGGREARQALESSAKDLQGCYEEALRQNPGLDGTLVAEVEPGQRVRLAADSVQDEGLSACVQGVVSQVRFPGGARLDIPIHFLLEPPTAAR